MNCPQCREALRPHARFCDSCGYAVSSSDASTERVDVFENGAEDAPDPHIGRTLDGKYELLARLGEGGMGTVYRARRVHIGDEVAVKVLQAIYVKDAATVERFRREARAAAQLQHPNIVTIHDFGEARGQDAPAYIVMELVRGQPLREIIRRAGKIEPQRAVALMRNICAGVGAAHRRNITHRDLKPDNVIVLPPDEEDERETVKVLDFGIAKLRDMAGATTLTQTGMMIGTPSYMSPEQCRGESLGARSDVYSLGAMLYEMLSGRPPFTAESVTGIITKHLLEPPPPLPEALRVPPALAGVIRRALAKQPEERPADAAAFSRELQTAMKQQAAPPLAAPAPGNVETRLPATLQAPGERQPALAPTVPAPTAKATGGDAMTTPAQASSPPPSAMSHATAKSEPISLSKPGLEPRAPAGERESEVFNTLLGAGLVGLALLVVSIAFVAWHNSVSETANTNRANQATNTNRAATPAASPASPSRAREAATPAPSPGTVVRNSMGMEFAYVPAGNFMMGSNDSPSEQPVHQVTFANGFYMGRYEVTQAQWQAVMGSNPSYFRNCGGNCPVEQVSWIEARVVINRLNAANDGYQYRLPTEAEWEYACRAGTTGDYTGNLDAMAWYRNNSNERPQPVGTKQPNAWGLYDMHGNVWEWVQDYWHENYNGAPMDGSVWLSGGDSSGRVVRGGSWGNTANGLRSAYRVRYTPDSRLSYIGFRLVAAARQ